MNPASFSNTLDRPIARAGVPRIRVHDLRHTYPTLMAEMALTRMRPKIAELRPALEGRFDDHHALMLSLHLGHIDQLTATIERLDAEVAREIDPFD